MSMAPTARRTIHLVLNFSTFFYSSGHQDQFADGGAANQPVVLEGSVGLSSGQVSESYGEFEFNFQWLPDWLGD